MSKDILVRMEIPILAHKIVNTPAMIFSRWMPLNEDEFIVIQGEGATLKLWFDRSCWHNITHAGGDIPDHVNVLVDKVFADVTLHSLSEGLVEYIKLTASEPHPPAGPYQQEYLRLGQKVYLLTITYLNRLISYARSLKGQYWLQEYPVDKVEGLYAVNLAFKACVLIDSEWFRWFPDVKQLIIGREGGCQDRDRLIDQSAWPEVKRFITSERQPSLVWELLAGAEWLAGIGHQRSALTEAVTALEVAISEFAKQPKAEEAFGSLITERMNVTSLKNWVEHMGLSGTVHYLFPVIFPEEKVPTEVLKVCQEAILQRENVVHRGQRDVQKDKLSRYLHAIRKMCRFLEAHQMI
jgi:hypothetical protein